MNAEIVYRLMKSFYGYFGGDPDTDEATLDALLHPSGFKEGKDPARLRTRMATIATALHSLSTDLEELSLTEAFINDLESK